MKWKLLPITVSLLMILLGCKTLVLSADAPRMTKEELKAMLDKPDLVILDVRYGKDWTESDMKIKGAIRVEPDDVKSWASKYPKDKTLVLYCA
jgi:rhodanese-related sulfurtransferase